MTASITRRLTLSVLLLEALAAVLLIVAVTQHERTVQFQTFEANLRATANALLGAVQEADSKDGNIILDLSSLKLPPRAIYRVTTDNGQLLGARGDLPSFRITDGEFAETRVHDHPYGFYILEGERIIDPGTPSAINHHVTVLFGLPEGRTWGAIWEATRYFILATLLLLSMTAILLTWLIRRSLLPIHDLAQEAGKVDAGHWAFDAPPASKHFSELRPLASALETVLARLERSFDQQRRFSSDAAHELKTDLAIVKSSMQLLKMKQRTAEEYEQGVALALNDIARMESTVFRMLTLARLEQSTTESQQSSDLTAIVQEAIAQSQPFADLHQVAVTHEGQRQPIEVPLCAEDALLLCSNLLVNAIQHSFPAGSIRVTTLREEATAILRICDYGEGIREEDKPYLFDPFYRGDASRSRKSGGTGLGLSISRAICVRASGSITIANHPDGGALVEVHLPCLKIPSET